ncbi:MAG: UDP-glucose 4-epimerase GalE [Flavobacteriaceae bacterium]|nr:UDP-glucose 4-epimerase GalE [Flavobacteriaceae bacterium]
MATVLVTGGLGYIGSHTVVCLLEAGHKVVVVDNLVNTSAAVLDGITTITGKTPEFYPMDLRHPETASILFSKHPDINAVIHFAAFKAVGESVEKPLDYYQNNLNTLVYLLQEVVKQPIAFIFSSSCTVYGQALELPIEETAPVLKAMSPYGNTKQIGEEILQDSCLAYPHLKVTALRYFNPIGAHESALIGELPLGVPQNLVPFITQTGVGKRAQLSVFGNDYPTPDGTCIRDYIHVVDLAEAHMAAMNRLLNNAPTASFEVFNVGTGKGSSVLEVIKAYEKVSGRSLPFVFAPPRQGDVTAAYANTHKASTILGWQSRFSLEEAMASALTWENKLLS